MDTSELMRIVREERLETPVLDGVGTVCAESVVLKRGDALLTVYVADERGGAIGATLRTFNNESDALGYVLLKLRQGTNYHRSLDSLPD